jgi:hypothetical protein
VHGELIKVGGRCDVVATATSSDDKGSVNSGRWGYPITLHFIEDIINQVAVSPVPLGRGTHRAKERRICTSSPLNTQSSHFHHELERALRLTPECAALHRSIIGPYWWRLLQEPKETCSLECRRTINCSVIRSVCAHHCRDRTSNYR